MKLKYVSAVSMMAVVMGMMATLEASPIELKGDIRLRTQVEDKKNDSNERRTRQRIRFRLKGKAEVTDQTQVKFGFATGSADQRSTNQTLENSFQTPDIRLDYAFVSHKVTDVLTVFGGKMKNPLWTPSDLLWDSDINPDGAAFRYNHDMDSFELILNTGAFVLDDKNGSDPSLFVIQPIAKMMIGDIKATGGLGVYFTKNVKNNTDLDSKDAGDTAKPDSYGNGRDKEYIPIVLSGQLDIHDTFGLELIRPFGEIVYNTNSPASDAEKGGIAGVKFGNKKVKGFGTWQVKASYRYLQSDAWLDVLPDSDAYGGKTNSKGFEVAVKYGLTKAVAVGLDVYSMDKISGDTQKQTLAQLDLSVKF